MHRYLIPTLTLLVVEGCSCFLARVKRRSGSCLFYDYVFHTLVTLICLHVFLWIFRMAHSVYD